MGKSGRLRDSDIRCRGASQIEFLFDGSPLVARTNVYKFI
jgi:hypothetical protein